MQEDGHGHGPRCAVDRENWHQVQPVQEKVSAGVAEYGKSYYNMKNQGQDDSLEQERAQEIDQNLVAGVFRVVEWIIDLEFLKFLCSV
jgi:hypothetical protein